MTTKSARGREGNQDFNIENEEFIPFIFRGYETKYKISKYGNVIGVRGHKLKWFYHSANYAGVGLTVPKGMSDDGYVYKNTRSKSTVTCNVHVHRFVALHFLPFPEYLPEGLKKDWEVISDETKSIITDGLVVDHIDGNRWNPRWDNLQWLTPKENNRRRHINEDSTNRK